MALSTGINFIQYNENMVGQNHPLALTDTLNRALTEFIGKFDSGDADTQVTRTHIKLASATDIQTDVVDDDIVWFNSSTSKWEKAYDANAVGIIDVANLIIYIFGKYTFKTLNTLTVGSKYYLNVGTPGAITLDASSGILIGTALTIDTILNVTTSSASAKGAVRADKYLSSLNIAAMIYDADSNLIKIQYLNATDVNYEILTYTAGDLTSIQHYINSVLQGTTTLSYTSGALTSVIFA